MTLDAYLELKHIEPVDFGRDLRTLKDPNSVVRYLRRTRRGRGPNPRFRRPHWDVMIDIYRQTRRLVSPNDWI